MKSCMCKISCNWLRVITLYKCRNMLVTHLIIWHACIIEFEVWKAYLARGNRIVCWRCYRCCVMIWTASMNLMECVASFGMDWRHLELQLVCELHLASSEKWTLWFWCYRSVRSVWIASIWCIGCVWIIGLSGIALYLKIRWLLGFEVSLRAKERNKRKQVL